MNRRLHLWIKPSAALLILGGLILVSPNQALDPWGLFNPRKLITLIFALTVLQALGVFFSRRPGVRMGALFSGFFGGIISSTATTAALARRSQLENQNRQSSTHLETLVFLAATAAMLVEGISILVIGTSQLPLELLLIFIGPLITTTGLILFQARRLESTTTNIIAADFEILPILKLSAFIALILMASKLLQTFFGQSGLATLTFLVSLFEIHGALIANIQLFEASEFNSTTLGNLLSISVAASYISKLFLVYLLGSPQLARRTLKLTLVVFLSLVASWSISQF